MVSNQCVDCPSTIKLRSFAEFVKKESKQFEKIRYPNTSFVKPSEDDAFQLGKKIGHYNLIKQQRVWVEELLTQLKKEKLIYPKESEIQIYYNGQIEFCEEMLEGLKNG